MGIYGNSINLTQEATTIESIDFVVFENTSFEELFNEFNVPVNEAFDGIKGTIKRKIDKLIELIKEFIKKLKTMYYKKFDKDKLITPYWDFYKKQKFEQFFSPLFESNFVSNSEKFIEAFDNIKSKYEKIKDKQTVLDYTVEDVEKEAKIVMNHLEKAEKDFRVFATTLGKESKLVKPYLFKISVASFMMGILKQAILELKPVTNSENEEDKE